jgi:dihydropteroate synthase
MDKNGNKSTLFSPKWIFEYRGKKMDFTVPRVMGILNVTPDSFYDGRRRGCGDKGKRGRGEEGKWMERVGKMTEEGAYIIDIGAVSTRPGAAEVSTEEEKRRLMPVLKGVRKSHPGLIISVDTYRAEIARMSAGEGADIINDISGGTFDTDMIPTITDLGIPFIIMHIQGKPENMQINPAYDDVVKEVHEALLHQAAILESSGHNKIILDPGFGFGKTLEHNYRLLGSLDQLVLHGFPVLAGFSRKSMINRVLNTRPEDALNGTTVLNTIALLKGAAILRVHDVKEAVEAVSLAEKSIMWS